MWNNIIRINEHASAKCPYFKFSFTSTVKTKGTWIKKFQKGQSLVKFWDCIVPPSALHCSVDGQFSTLDVKMRNTIKKMRSPIKCKRTAQEWKSLDNPLPDALEAHIFIGLSVSEFSSFMALKMNSFSWFTVHIYQFILKTLLLNLNIDDF